MSETQRELRKNITVVEAVHRKLEVLADSEHRTLGGEVEYLIDKELESKGIDPDTLQPALPDKDSQE